MVTKIISFFDDPWGGGKKSGNNSGNNQSSTNQAPDLDIIFKKYKKKLDNFSPDFKSVKGIILALLGMLFLWLITGFYTVQPDQQALILRFGEYNRTMDPGLHYRLPSPIEKLLKVRVTKINSIEVGYQSLGKSNVNYRTEESLMLTGDENIVDINFEVQWKIKDAYNFLFNIRDYKQGATVKSAAESAMREVIGKTKIALVLAEGRDQVEQETKFLLQDILDSYKSGIEIVRLQLLKVDPPSQVIDAFRDVQTAKLDKERAINQAQAYRMGVIPTARGNAQKILEEAKGYQEKTIAEANGKAQRFKDIYAEYAKAPIVTKKRLYIETMEQVFSQANVTIVDSNTTNTGVVPYLPLKN
jgi:membrane protease subunit HflK